MTKCHGLELPLEALDRIRWNPTHRPQTVPRSNPLTRGGLLWHVPRLDLPSHPPMWPTPCHHTWTRWPTGPFNAMPARQFIKQMWVHEMEHSTKMQRWMMPKLGVSYESNKLWPIVGQKWEWHHVQERVLNAVITVELNPAEFSAGLMLERCRLQVYDRMNFLAKISGLVSNVFAQNGSWGRILECPDSVTFLTTKKKGTNSQLPKKTHKLFYLSLQKPNSYRGLGQIHLNPPRTIYASMVILQN